MTPYSGIEIYTASVYEKAPVVLTVFLCKPDRAFRFAETCTSDDEGIDPGSLTAFCHLFKIICKILFVLSQKVMKVQTLMFNFPVVYSSEDGTSQVYCEFGRELSETMLEKDIPAMSRGRNQLKKST